MTALLAADIGGTKANFWLFEQSGGVRKVRREARLTSADYPNARSAVAAFLEKDRVGAAAIAIAGPVVDGRAQTPNLPWEVEQSALARVLGTERVELLNDLAATAHGVAELGPDGLETLNDGIPGNGAVAIIAAGTGLGECGLSPIAMGRMPIPSEGGHADFGPANDVEIDLFRYLSKRYEHVSWERVVSGPGLLGIYEFLVDTGRGEARGELRRAMAAGDPSAAISRAALDESDETASRALDIFVALYGAEAGNLALKLLATGGVFVAGGIAPKILKRLSSGLFMERFVAKGRHSDLLRRIPVKVVLEPKTALIGAARRAVAMGTP